MTYRAIATLAEDAHEHLDSRSDIATIECVPDRLHAAP